MRIIKIMFVFVALLYFAAGPLSTTSARAQGPAAGASKNGSAETLVMSAEQREAFRAAKTVRVVSQVSAADPENLLQPPKLNLGEKAFVQPIDEFTASVLKKVGVVVKGHISQDPNWRLNVVKDDGGPVDLTLHVQATVETRASETLFGSAGGKLVAIKYQGIGARWHGSVTVSAAKVPRYTLNFQGDTVTPDPNKAVTVEIANPDVGRLAFFVPANHAAGMALLGPGSYAAAIQDLVGQTHGTETLFEVLKDPQNAAWWRGTAASTLGWLGGKEAADLLIELLKDAAAEVRSGAAYGLGRSGDQRAIEPLLKVLNDASPAVRSRAAIALGQLADNIAAEPLIETTLNDAVDEVSMRAARALAQLSDPTVIKRLADALRDKDGERRRRAVRALGKLSGKDNVEPLAMAAKDESVAVRQEATKALALLNSPRSSEIILEALRDSSPDVRVAAITALGNSDDPRVVEALLPTLNDSDATVQRKAIKALAERGDRRAAPRLLPLLQDKDTLTRQVVAESLGRVCDAGCVEPLIVALKDKDARVRAAIANVLAQITGERFGEDKKQWEKWLKQNQKTPAG